ncbi:MAG: twin-arginine translocase subunit TatC, partial [Methanobacteriota archaeon]
MKDTTNQGRDDETPPESGTTEQPSPYAPPDEPEGQEVSPESPEPASDQPESEPTDTGTPEPDTGSDAPFPEEPFRYDDEGVPADEWQTGPASASAEPPATDDSNPPELAAPPPPPSPPSNGDDTEDDDGEDRELGARMTFLEHLDELRKRILYSIIGLAVGFAVCWVFREEIYAFISYPILQVLERLVVTKPTEAFTIYMKVAFVGGIFLTSPVILIQVWMFIAPGLYVREKRFVLPFLFSSTILFLAGGAFAYYIILPPALKFLILDFGAQFTPMIRAEDYFDLVFLIIVGMGAVFQLPVLIAFLSMFGLVTPRFLWKNFRYAFLLITI